jgi:hypothetical protein
MGILYPYFPVDLALKLAQSVNATTFVETGTYMGKTTKWASTHFNQVYTVELSENLFNLVRDELLSKSNIIPYLGDSRNVLPEILDRVGIADNVVYFLDGHYSAGGTAGKDDPCPLLKELEIILQYNKDDIIFIDDARCVGSEGWPTMIEIAQTIVNVSKIKKQMYVFDDVIVLIPNLLECKNIAVNYIGAVQ